VRITTPLPYAGIHNEGGTITTHPTITPRMRRMAWARVYKLAGVKKGEKMPKQLPVKAQMWRSIALTKKAKLTINAKIPQRKFIGESAELRKKIDDVIMQTLQKIMQSSR
jgi:phage gpG-like protein